MAKAHKQATKVAASIKPVVGASTLADLETRTNTEAATAPRAPGLRVGQSFTGQYLYNRLIDADKSENTKMDIVRSMVAALDVEQFKHVLSEFVAIPVGYRDNMIKELKKNGTYNAAKPTPELAAMLARVKTALNHQTVMRVAFGALKFCGNDLTSFGYTVETGYQTMAVISRKALEAARIKWDGTKVLNDNEAARKTAAKAETKALERVMESMPRDDGETMTHYLARCGGKVQEQLSRDNEEREHKKIADLIMKVRAMAGPMLDDVVDGILKGEGLSPTVEAEGLNPEAAAAAAAVAVKH